MAQSNHHDAIDKKVNALVGQMTFAEKIAQLGSCWVYELQSNGKLDKNKIAVKLANGIGQVTRNASGGNLTLAEAARSANALQKFLVERTRLGIPAIIHEECCSGAMVPGGSVFPQMIGLASTFQPELAEQMAAMIRQQMRALGIHQGLAPVLDIARDPRWGRVEETFGEDPTLVSQFGIAYIKGLQGRNLTQGVMATAKHFVGHSFSLGGLNCAPVLLGLRELWEVYLAPFQAAIRDSGLASIMNAYPELDGELVAASRRILTEWLRGTLGFSGLVVSDYEAVEMIHTYHRAAESRRAAAVKALTAGIDVELPTVSCYGADLLAALKAGEISLETIDLSVSRHLRKKFELDLFESPYVNEGEVVSVYETPVNRALAHEIACKSIVLLKNDGVLPIQKGIGKIAVIGPNAASSRSLLGDYSYNAYVEMRVGSPPDGSVFCTLSPADASKPTVSVPTILEAIQKDAPSVMRVSYAQGCEVNSTDESGFDDALRLARDADLVVLVMGTLSGLSRENTTGEFRDTTDLDLPGVQEKLVSLVAEAGKPVILILVSGRPLAIPRLVDKMSAILHAWVPGEEGGRAVADVLFGKVNPSGKLPISIPRSAGQIPVFYNHKPSGSHSVIYGDYVNEKATPLFPFGHGLSYSRFKYSNLSIGSGTAEVGTIDIAMTLENGGPVAGEEVAQLYICDEYASYPRPVKELKGFARVSLAAGESRRIVFHLPVDQLAYFGDDLQLTVEAGRFIVMLGSSSEDIRLKGEFFVDVSKLLPVGKRVFVCPVDIL